MTTVLFIPARFASSRFPGKPLAELTLPDGTRKPLIRLTWEAAIQMPGVDACHILTEDARIASVARGFGASVLLTSDRCRNGTERCAEALGQMPALPDIVINLQGDAPLTPPWFVTDLVAALRADPGVQMATPVLRCDAGSLARFVEDRRAGRVGATTAVFDAGGNALYFSKELIPHIGSGAALEPPQVFHHVGLYAYRAAALTAYAGWPEGRLERLEGLEQLRFLEHRAAVRCVEVAARGRMFWEVNHPHDIGRIERLLRAAGSAPA